MARWRVMRKASLGEQAYVLLILTRMEAKGLYKLAGEGAEGIFTDKVTTRDIMPGPLAPAADRALTALRDGVWEINREEWD